MLIKALRPNSPLPLREGPGVRACSPRPAGEGSGVRACSPRPTTLQSAMAILPHPQPFSLREKGVQLPSPCGRGAGGEGLLPSTPGRGAGGEGLSPTPIIH